MSTWKTKGGSTSLSLFDNIENPIKQNNLLWAIQNNVSNPKKTKAMAVMRLQVIVTVNTADKSQTRGKAKSWCKTKWQCKW